MVAKSATPSCSTRSALGHVAAPGVVDDEAGRVLAAHRLVAVALRERDERVADPGLGEHAVHHLDDLHHRHRVEEVVAGDAPGPARRPRPSRSPTARRCWRRGCSLRRRPFPAPGTVPAWARAPRRSPRPRRGRAERRRARRRSRCAPSVWSASAWDIRVFCTSPASALPIASFAACAAPGCASNTSVRTPHWASTCAMPRPMVPLPATPATRSGRWISSMGA